MANKPIELTSEASGRTYTWDKPEPPTDRDIAELMAADRAFLEERAEGQEKVLEAAKSGAMFSGVASLNPVQFREAMRGQEISGPEIAGAAASGTVPGGGLTKMGIRGFAKEVGKQAGANVGGLALQRFLEGKPLDEKEAAMFTGMAAVSTALGKLVDPGKIATAVERRAIHDQQNDLAMKALQSKGIKILPGTPQQGAGSHRWPRGNHC